MWLTNHTQWQQHHFVRLRADKQINHPRARIRRDREVAFADQRQCSPVRTVAAQPCAQAGSPLGQGFELSEKRENNVAVSRNMHSQGTSLHGQKVKNEKRVESEIFRSNGLNPGSTAKRLF
jgi:hypothetical protein